MMKKAVVISIKWIQILFLGLTLSSCSSCKEESPNSASSPTRLVGPTVFVPVGLLKSPRGIAVDTAGNIWVADTRNNRLRRFTAGGIQTDSLIVALPSSVALDKGTRNHLLIVENLTTVSRFSLQSKTFVATYVLSPFTGNSSFVLDVGLSATVPMNTSIRELGDVDTSPTGDIFVSAKGSPANSIIKILPGGSVAIAASTVDSATTLARFLAVDGFGTVFTSFSVNRGPTILSLTYLLTPGNILQSRSAGVLTVSMVAQGATIDDSGKLYIADPATQELVIASTAAEIITGRYIIPDVNGYSMIPRDVAVTRNGTVYVLINDRLGTDAGAILKYTQALP